MGQVKIAEIIIRVIVLVSAELIGCDVICISTTYGGELDIVIKLISVHAHDCTV